MDNSFYILVIGLVVIGVLLAIHKLIKIFDMIKKEKSLLDDNIEETRTQKNILRLIQILLFVPVVIILIYIIVKGF